MDANATERQAVLVTAKEYLLSDPSERNVDIPIMVVKQGFEPPNFTGYFGAWDDGLWPEPVSYLLCRSGSTITLQMAVYELRICVEFCTLLAIFDNFWHFDNF